MMFPRHIREEKIESSGFHRKVVQSQREIQIDNSMSFCYKRERKVVLSLPETKEKYRRILAII